MAFYFPSIISILSSFLEMILSFNLVVLFLQISYKLLGQETAFYL